ncbi:hypothetical protein R6Z07F_020541 [Ovis aries]
MKGREEQARWGPHQQLQRHLFSVQLTSLPPPPPPYRPRCQGRLLRDSQLGSCHLPRGHHCRPITVWHSLPCLDCHRGARLDPRWPGQGWRRGGRDPSPLGVPAPAWEGTDGVEEAAVLLPSLRVSGALRRGHGGPQATVEEEWDIEPLEEEESDFELKDLGEEEHLEDAEHLLDEVEEEETLVDEESEQGGAAVVAGDVDPLEQFVSVFWALVHSLLHSFSYDDHGLIWPLAPARWSGTAPGLPQALQSVLRLRRIPVPTSVLYFTKEASDYQYENSDEEVQEAEGGEEDSDENPEEGPEKDLDPAEDSPRKPRYLCAALSITQPPFLAYIFKFSLQIPLNHRQPIGVFAACLLPSQPRSQWAGLRAAPLPFLSRGGPHQHLRKLLFPEQPSSLRPPPPPLGPTANSVSSTGHSARRPPSSPQTSLQAPSLLGVQASVWEGMEGVEEATALLASLEVSSALPGEQGWPQAAVEEECGREPLEEEEMEEDVEEMEEDEEEGEIDFGLEDVEEEEHLPREYEEEEDENEQEGAAAVAGLEFPVERFGPLFWSHVDSFLRNFRNNKHVLFRPHADRLMAGGHSQAPSDPGEGPVPPQEQEDLGEGGQVLQGLDSAADFKLGYFSRQLLTPKSASFCPNDEGEDQYENSDEEEEDGNEKPGEGLEMDVVSAKGSSGGKA